MQGWNCFKACTSAICCFEHIALLGIRVPLIYQSLAQGLSGFLSAHSPFVQPLSQSDPQGASAAKNSDHGPWDEKSNRNPSAFPDDFPIPLLTKPYTLCEAVFLPLTRWQTPALQGPFATWDPFAHYFPKEFNGADTVCTGAGWEGKSWRVSVFQSALLACPEENFCFLQSFIQWACTREQYC